MFAVRQWPGNGADLDFRGVLEGCAATIVAAAPIEGTLLKEDGKESMANPLAKAAFLESDEYDAVAKVLPFCRLWCVRLAALFFFQAIHQPLLRPSTHLDPAFTPGLPIHPHPPGAWWRWPRCSRWGSR